MQQNAIEFLISEHDQVESLFRQLEAGPTPTAVTEELVRLISGHDAIERSLLYPLVRDKVPEVGEGLAEHSLDEHQEQARLLAEIEKAMMADNLDDVAGLWPQLVTAVRAHVLEEQTVVFPRLREVTEEPELVELALKMEKMRKKGPTHAHPHTPRSGMGAKLVGKIAAAMDHVVDKTRKAS
jgi:hemerythrin superfamily protein